jgi:hypothetical protein
VTTSTSSPNNVIQATTTTTYPSTTLGYSPWWQVWSYITRHYPAVDYTPSGASLREFRIAYDVLNNSAARGMGATGGWENTRIKLPQNWETVGAGTALEIALAWLQEDGGRKIKYVEPGIAISANGRRRVRILDCDIACAKPHVNLDRRGLSTTGKTRWYTRHLGLEHPNNDGHTYMGGR